MRTVMIILILLAFALVACGGNDNAPAESNEQVSAQATATPLPTATPWPTLPPTNVPPDDTHQGHIFPVGTRTIHVVQQGETLGYISNLYSVPLDAIADANRIYDMDSIDTGEILFIPPCE